MPQGIVASPVRRCLSGLATEETQAPPRRADGGSLSLAGHPVQRLLARAGLRPERRYASIIVSYKNSIIDVTKV
jgi:hypothetical protein